MTKRKSRSNPRNDNNKMEGEEKKKKRKITTTKSLPSGPRNPMAMKSKVSKENTIDKYAMFCSPRITRSTMQRSAPSGSIEESEGTQLKECEQIGEQFDDLGEFAKAIVRFQRETQLQLGKKYNGEEEDGFAIQGGGSFSERGNFEDIDMMSLDDVDVDLDVSVDVDVDVDIGVDANASANVNVVGAEADAYAEANVIVDASVEADSDANSDACVEADSNADAEVDMEADSDAGAEVGVEEDADAEAKGTEGIILSNMVSPESSKQAVGRTRKEKLSTQAASKNAPSAGLHMFEEEDSNDLGGDDPNELTRDTSDLSKKTQKTTKITSENAPSAGLNISEEENSNDLGGEDPNELTRDMSDLSKKMQKTTKTRGPTKCRVFSMESESRIEVQLNSNGQPIEKPSEILSSYVGHLARNMVPITYNDWRKIPVEKKEYYWHKIMQKFTFNGREEEAKTYTLQEMGKLWRSHKSRLGTKLENKPRNIDSEEGQTFVKQRLSEKFKEKSTKFKEMRKKQSIPYTGSRKGFARMEDEIKKEGPIPESKLRLLAWIKGYTNKDGEATSPEAAELIKKAKELLASDILESSPTSYVKDDALPQFIGPKRRRKVGVVAVKVSPYLEKKIVSLNGKLDEMSSLVAKQKKLLDTLMNKQVQNNHSRAPATTPQVHNQQQQVEYFVQNNQSRAPTTTPQAHNQQQLVEHCVQNKHSRAPTTTSQTHDGRTNRVSRKCKLINWIVPDEIVAIGRWVSSDPKMMVHSVPLGRNASRVWIDEVEQPSTPLWRETSNMETIEEAMGSAIAWPTDHLIMMD